MPIQVAKEKLRADIFDRVNTCNMLLYQMRQRSQAQDKLQRRLQQLQDAEMDEEQQQAQVPRTPSQGGFHPTPIPMFHGWVLGSACWVTPCPPAPISAPGDSPAGEQH